MNGTEPSVTLEGRVEVCDDKDNYGTVCDDFWDTLEAKVVCRQLEYEGTGKYSPNMQGPLSFTLENAFYTDVIAVKNGTYGHGNGSIVLDDLLCLGSEEDLFQCSTTTYGQHDCSHLEDAGVICGGERPSVDTG